MSTSTRQLMEIYINMRRRPASWMLPEKFGHLPNTDFKSVWQEINRLRFGVPWDPRNCPKEWFHLPHEWIARLMIDSATPQKFAASLGGKLTSKEAHVWLTVVSQAFKSSKQWAAPYSADGYRLASLSHTAQTVALGSWAKPPPWFRTAGKTQKEALACRNSLPVGNPAFPHPHVWLLKSRTSLTHIPKAIPSRLVVDWIIRKHKTKGFDVPKIVWQRTGSYVRRQEHRLVNMLDEIQEVDLKDGVLTSPEVVKEAVFYRRGEDYAKKLRELNAAYATLPGAWNAPVMVGVVHIDNSVRLVEESESMLHCAMGYHDRIVSGDSFFLSIVTEEGRSTVELDRNHTVNQHRGVENAKAPEANVKLLNVWLRQLAPVQNSYSA